MFANPFPLKEYSLDESLWLFREMMEARASPHATTAQVIALLPPAQRRLAESRHAGGSERDSVGRSVAHLQLSVVGPAFRDRLRALSGLRLGCFCEESELCHAKVLAELCHISASEAKDHEADPAVRVEKRKRLDENE